MKQYIYLLLASLSITSVVLAQPRIIKQITIGGTNLDQTSCIAWTKDGGSIVGGTSYSNISGDKTENSKGNEDYWIVKLDSNMHIQWQKDLGGISGEFMVAIQQTTDGGYIAGGSSASGISGNKTQPNRGVENSTGDYWIIKLDADGNIQWDKTIGGNNSDYLGAMQQTADGGYILGGRSNSDISGEKTQNSNSSFDYWIVKTDNLGNVQWDKTIGTTGYEELTSLQQTSDGGYILGGNSDSGISVDKTEASRGDYDYWIVKTDSLGNIQWDKTAGSSVRDNLTYIQQTFDGGYIAGGYTTGNASGDKTENSHGYYDCWLVKYNSHGRIQWDKTIGGDNFDQFSTLQQTRDSGLIIGATSQSGISGDKTEPAWANSDDYWVVKLNKNGAVEWDKTIGGTNVEFLTGIKEVKRNSYVMAGYSLSGVSGDKTQHTRGNADYWVVALNYKKPLTSITASDADEIHLQNKQLTIYPNPAKDILHIQNTGKATVTLTDQSGKIILTKTISNNGEINVAHLPAGLYYLKNNTTGEVEKVMIAK